MERIRTGLGELWEVRLPRPAPPPVDPAGFLLCALPCPCPVAAQWQQDLYCWAFAQARAAALPSLPERDLLGVWN